MGYCVVEVGGLVESTQQPDSAPTLGSRSSRTRLPELGNASLGRAIVSQASNPPV